MQKRDLREMPTILSTLRSASVDTSACTRYFVVRYRAKLDPRPGYRYVVSHVDEGGLPSAHKTLQQRGGGVIIASAGELLQVAACEVGAPRCHVE